MYQLSVLRSIELIKISAFCEVISVDLFNVLFLGRRLEHWLLSPAQFCAYCWFGSYRSWVRYLGNLSYLFNLLGLLDLSLRFCHSAWCSLGDVALSSVIEPVLSDFNVSPPQLNLFLCEFILFTLRSSLFIYLLFKLSGGCSKVETVTDENIFKQILTLICPFELA